MTTSERFRIFATVFATVFLFGAACLMTAAIDCGDDIPPAVRVPVVDGAACVEVTPEAIRAVPCDEDGGGQ